MENHGYTPELMNRRLAEVVTYFGLESLIHRDVDGLSTGEQQKVCVAAAMAMKPDLLLLDEPTSSLDPIATEDLCNLLCKIHDELGTTIIIAEHHVDVFLPIIDRVYGLKKYSDQVELEKNENTGEKIRLDSLQEIKDEIRPLKQIELPKEKNDDSVLELNDVWYRYPGQSEFAIKSCDLKLHRGVVTFLVGGNGSGKSTLAKLICGHFKQNAGKILCYDVDNKKDEVKKKYKKNKGIKTRTVDNNIAYLPPEVRYLFLRESIAEEIASAGEKARAYLERLELAEFVKSDRSPMDISVGERERLGLALVLATDADIYVLDEPTRGLDADALRELEVILKEKTDMGKTVLVITHDIEFAGRSADYISMVFDGRVVASDERERFLTDNLFYTTASHRLTSK